MRQTIGVVGYGFVGKAVAAGFCTACDVAVYDKVQGYVRYGVDGLRTTTAAPYAVDPLKSLVEVTDGPIFICVPTPMEPDGSCDTSIVEEVVAGLGASRTIVLKSTVPPGTTSRLAEKYGARICFNPEFLTEANSVEDFANQDHIILGGPLVVNEKVADLYDLAFPGVHQEWVSARTAEMVKYVTNCFLATKVSLANEIKRLCAALSIPYERMIEVAKLDSRLGESHWQVPGPDEHYGFGGSCFIKDVNALLNLMRRMDTPRAVLEGAWQTNLQVRPERDWEQLKGRAVV